MATRNASNHTHCLPIEDGKKFVVLDASPKRTLHGLLDAEKWTYNELATHEGFHTKLAAVSTDGKRLAVFGQSPQGPELCLLNIGESVSQKLKTTPNRLIEALHFLPHNGKLLAAFCKSSNSVSILEYGDQIEPRMISVKLFDDYNPPAYGQGIQQFTSNSDGSRAILSLKDETLLVVDLSTGTLIHQLIKGGESFQILSDGRTVVTNGEKLRVWDLELGVKKYELPTPEKGRLLLSVDELACILEGKTILDLRSQTEPLRPFQLEPPIEKDIFYVIGLPIPGTPLEGKPDLVIAPPPVTDKETEPLESSNKATPRKLTFGRKLIPFTEYEDTISSSRDPLEK